MTQTHFEKLGEAGRNRYLIAGGILSLMASVLHLVCIVGGPDWYRFLGAGEEMAQMAERGEIYPAVLTFLIAAVLFVWALYAFSGAGLIRKLPFLKTGLTIISAIYLLRGLALVPGYIFVPDLVTPFLVWSSLISGVYGICYAVGTMQVWRD